MAAFGYRCLSAVDYIKINSVAMHIEEVPSFGII